LHFALPDIFSLSANDSSKFIPSYIYNEMNFNYDENIKNIPDNCDLRGYFQSEKYFKKYKNDLKTKEFVFHPQIESSVSNFLQHNTSELVCVHIRLGDYVFNQNCHPVCTLDYYKTALKDILSLNVNNDIQIVLLSDDYTEANKMLREMGLFVIAHGTENKFFDMCLMTKCQYHVIANSSFSWWGAWLSNSKMTIAPKKWFGDASHMPKTWDDIYAENWITI
jgi:hypothetical protein